MTMLAVSALCWERDGDLGQLAGWRAMGLQGVEAVPGRILPSWPLLVEYEARTAHDAADAEELLVPAMQAILFGKPEALLFSGTDMFAKAVMEAAILAHILGAPCMVWGAPGSRRRGAMAMGDAMKTAVAVLRPLCDRLHGEYGLRLLIEHDPTDYGCDFVTTPDEAVLLAEAVDSPGFGFHLDVGGLETADEAIPHLHRAGHVHASQRGLGSFIPGVLHTQMASALRKIPDAWVSLEMLPSGGEQTRDMAIREFVNWYGDCK